MQKIRYVKNQQFGQTLISNFPELFPLKLSELLKIAQNRGIEFQKFKIDGNKIVRLRSSSTVSVFDLKNFVAFEAKNGNVLLYNSLSQGEMKGLQTSLITTSGDIEFIQNEPVRGYFPAMSIKKGNATFKLYDKKLNQMYVTSFFSDFGKFKEFIKRFEWGYNCYTEKFFPISDDYQTDLRNGHLDAVFFDSAAVFQNERGWFFEGDEENIFHSIKQINNEKFLIYDKENHVGVYDARLKKILIPLENKYDSIKIDETRSNLYNVSKDGNFGVFDVSKDVEAVPCKFFKINKDISGRKFFCNDFDGNSFHIEDQKIIPIKEIASLGDGVSAMSSENRVGLYSLKDCSVLIPFEFNTLKIGKGKNLILGKYDNNHNLTESLYNLHGELLIADVKESIEGKIEDTTSKKSQTKNFKGSNGCGMESI